MVASRLAGLVSMLASAAGPQPQSPCGSHSGPLGSLGSYCLMVASRLAGPSPLGSLGSYCLMVASRLAGPSPLGSLGSYCGAG